jgi:hypothetical protein
MKRLKVEGYNNLVRDGRTGAILNTNRIEIERAKKQKQAEQQKRDHIETLTAEVKTLKEDMSQIKDLLFRLVEGKDD